MQGCRALGDLPVFTDSHARPDMLTEFVTAQTDKLKNMCNKEKRELFSHTEEDLCKCDQFGSPNLIITLVCIFPLNVDKMISVYFFSPQCQKSQSCVRKQHQGHTF